MLKIFSQYETRPGVISLCKFESVLTKMGFQVDLPQVASLLRLLQSEPDEINFPDTLKNLQQKPFSWWAEFLHNASFDSKNKVSKLGNFSQNIQLNPETQLFYSRVIQAKLKSKGML